MVKSTPELEKKVIKNIIENGFLFELQVQKKFNKKEWFTKPNLIFKTEEKELEIDLIAHKVAKKETYNHLNGFDVICSCKKSKSNPWVFFLSDRQRHHHIYNILKMNSNKSLVSTSNPYELFRPNETKINLNLLPLNNFDYFAKTYLVSLTSPGTKNSKKIYESISDILLCMKYKLYKEKMSLATGRTAQLINTIQIPIISLQGILYGVKEENGKIDLKEYDFIPLIIDSGEDSIGQVLIYVVKEEYLNSFIDILGDSINYLDKEIESFYKKIGSLAKNP